MRVTVISIVFSSRQMVSFRLSPGFLEVIVFESSSVVIRTLSSALVIMSPTLIPAFSADDPPTTLFSYEQYSRKR